MCATARSRVNDEETPQSLPRGARMKDYSDKEAVQSRELRLVSTSPPPFSDVQTCASYKRGVVIATQSLDMFLWERQRQFRASTN